MPHDNVHAVLHDEYMQEKIGLTVIECIAKSWNDAKHGFQPYETIDTYHKNIKKPEAFDYEYARETIDYWRNHFVTRRFRGDDVSTPWQQGMIELVSNTDSIVRRSQLKLIATIPKYTEHQQRWDNYALLYKSVQRDPSLNQHTGLNLTLVEKYTHSTRRKSEHTVFVLRDIDTNELYTYEIERNLNEKLFLEVILNFKNNVIKCDLWSSVRMFNSEFNYRKIAVFDHIE